MNDMNPTELEHDDRGRPERTVKPSHADMQRAVDVVNAIQRDLFAKLDEIDAKHGPDTSHRLGLHRAVVQVLADHRDAIALMFASPTARPLPFVVGDPSSRCGDPMRVVGGLRYDDPGSVYDSPGSVLAE